MSDGRTDFETRRARLLERHRARARRRTAAVPGTGRLRFQLPLRGFVLLMVFLILFKGFLLASLGAATYELRLNILEDGSILGTAGAFVMGIDPVSQTIANLLIGLT